MILIVGVVILAAILIFGTIGMGRSATRSTEEAVRSVSLLYLDELAGRREDVVAGNLQNNIDDIYIGVSLMTEEDLSDLEHLQAYQAKIKKLYGLEKFAFVNSDGVIYTANGIQYDIDQYSFPYQTLSEPDISVKNLNSKQKSVIIAVPLEDMTFEGKPLVVCFEEIEMERLLSGVSLQTSNQGTTFCNVYTKDGVALTNMVLGGLASEDNLLEAMEHAEYEEGYSAEKVADDFENLRPSVVSFTYGDVKETLYYVPVEGTDWMLTYLIRESVISEQFSGVSKNIITRSLIQVALTAVVLIALFIVMVLQVRRSTRLAYEKEASETASRIKQEELEERIALQEQLLEQEKQRTQQDNMITALASDYSSVYYVDLDTDEGICYRMENNQQDEMKEGDHFSFHERFQEYAEKYVAESYRDSFLSFIDPANIREGLEKEQIISYRYLVNRNGEETYEMLRMAGVRHPEDRTDHMVHAVGVGFSDVDSETRMAMDHAQALSDALGAAEEANKAKTVFLSNMSHEIRTPMNAIIGLDNIALNDPDISDKTRDYLEKMGASANHLLTIINDILDMSRIESGRMTLKNEEFAFPTLLEQINTIISGQCQDRGLEYECQVDNNIDDYYIGDDMKLRQVMLNILGNAVKFTPEGGRVELHVERTAHFDNKSTLRLTMKDTGIGMDKEFLPKIFNAFAQEDASATNKYGSSGLGMAITKSIVEMMNGQIEVESEKGKGSTFTVTVTLMDSDRKASDEDVREIRPQELKVLVIDDDPIACEHAKLVLEKVGISSEICLSGKEAIEMVRLRHARRDPYNLILVDWKMPDMDGVETTRKIREIVGNESAIIILTAYRWDDILEEALDAGVDTFIAKPLFASNVLEIFRAAFRQKDILASEKINKAELKGRRILLAEDVDVNAEIMMMVLSMREMEVEHAENGRIAVDMFESHPEHYYDAILMDMRMPEMDGLEATRVIRAMDREDAKTIPIIALTANAFDEDVQRSLQAGLNAHLSKPVEPDNLFQTLEGLIKE